MNEDALLLRRFVEDHAEDAFTELVRRHLTLVYGAALRRVGGDAHLAQDVSQTVFISLASKAASLRTHASLAGWLYIATHRATAEVVRREQRRKQHEASAHSMNLSSTPEDAAVDPAALRPLLDDALVELKDDDREAVVLRYFAQRSFAEIGSTLRITEEAARKRVERAVERLHRTLSRRGITSSVTALGSALAAGGMTVAPATLVTQVSAAALAQTVLIPAVTLGTTLASALLPAAAVATVLTALWTIVPQQRANAVLADEIARLEREPLATAVVRSEINDLKRAIALARTPATTPSPIPGPTTAVAASSFSTSRPSGSAPKEVFVTTDGRIKWEGEPVTLDEFLRRIADYRRTAPNGSPIVVKGNGVHFGQLNWVLVEAAASGITSLVVESDSEPGPSFSNNWF
jgi:RNA polymerase sigma factor (sigma-70 family)